MILLIVNNNPYHYEIIESVINQYDKILSINKTQISKILLKIIPDESFIAYIKMKYPAIIINGNSYFNMKYLTYACSGVARARKLLIFFLVRGSATCRLSGACAHEVHS